MKFAFRTLIFVGLFYAIAPLAYAETSLDELQQLGRSRGYECAVSTGP